jgi:hypothetical protein
MALIGCALKTPRVAESYKKRRPETGGATTKRNYLL